MKKLKVSRRELVLCAGPINYLYAKSMHQELPRDIQPSISIEAFYPGDSVIVDLKNEASKRRRNAIMEKTPYDTIWLFFNCPSCCAAHLGSFAALRSDYRLAYAPVCIEHWFMLHFEEYSRSFTNPEEAIVYLNKLWPAYKRGNINAYRELLDRMPIAIQRADQFNINTRDGTNSIENNSYFTVQSLIQYFEALKSAA